jgi:hypothetical protein
VSRTLPLLDNSAVSTYNECARKYQYQYVMHYQKPISAALHFGRVWHAALDKWYASAGDTELAKQTAIESWGAINFPGDHRTIFRILEALERYFKQYGNPGEHRQTFGHGSSAPLVEMAVQLQWPEIPIPYIGKIDRVIERDDGEVFVWDHKTVSRMDGSFFKGFEMASQMLGYTKLMSEHLQRPVAGVVVNAYNVTPTGKTDRFERMYIELPRSRVEYWATRTLPAQMLQIQFSYEHDHWPQNHQSCTTKYGLCPYFDVCTLPESRRAAALALDYEVREWNPLAAD